MAKTEVIHCKTKHVVNSIWFLVLKDRFAARQASCARHFTNNRFSKRSSFTFWIPLTQVQVLSELPNWLLTSSSAGVCMQEGDVVTIHLPGSRTCFNLKQRRGWVDAASVWEWANYDNSLLPLLFFFPSIRAHLCFGIKLWHDRYSENHSWESDSYTKELVEVIICHPSTFNKSLIWDTENLFFAALACYWQDLKNS